MSLHPLLLGSDLLGTAGGADDRGPDREGLGRRSGHEHKRRRGGGSRRLNLDQDAFAAAVEQKGVSADKLIVVCG